MRKSVSRRGGLSRIFGEQKEKVRKRSGGGRFKEKKKKGGSRMSSEVASLPGGDNLQRAGPATQPQIVAGIPPEMGAP